MDISIILLVFIVIMAISEAYEYFVVFPKVADHTTDEDKSTKNIIFGVNTGLAVIGSLLYFFMDSCPPKDTDY